MRSKGYACSVIGGRSMNQDSFLINDAKGLYAVADGVGGGMKGEVASKMATDGLDLHVSQVSDRLMDVFSKLQDAIYKEAMNEFGEPVMGTTLTAVGIYNQVLKFCHVGDSRLYHFTQNVLRQLTEDQEFYDEGMQATVLSSYLGVPADVHPLRLVEDIAPVTAADKLLLCSDGLYRQMNEARMVALIRQHQQKPQELVEALCQEASRKEYSDNVTVVYVELFDS